MRACAMFALCLTAAACGGRAQELDVTAPEPGPERGGAPAGQLPALDPHGLWPLERAREQLAMLAERGVDIESGALDHVAGATVRVGSCAGAFVSPHGLAITSQRCVEGISSDLGARDEKLGFLAADRTGELPTGPELALRVLLRDDDVTDQVRAGLEDLPGDVARGAHIEARIDELTAACQGEHVECEVVAERSGARYRQLRFLVIPDVRIAYVPTRGAAASGPADRGRWPRAAAGVALVRAYVGPDGAPAAPALENEPFRSDRTLAISTANARAGDLVAVAGFPGPTYRDEPLAAFEQERTWRTPRGVQIARALYEAVHGVLRDDPDSSVARQRTRGLEDRLRGEKAVLAGLAAGADRRRAAWDRLEYWLSQDAAAEAVVGEAVTAVVDAHSRRWRTRDRDAAITDLEESAFFRAARAVVQAARARDAAEQDAAPGQTRPLAPIALEMPEGDHPAVDRAVLGAVLERAGRWANIHRDWLREALAMATFEPELVNETIDAFFARSELGDPLVRERLFTSATVAELERSQDPFVAMALVLSPQFQGVEMRARQLLGARAAWAPDYHRALDAARGGRRAPDANGSLRISFGQIRGYRPNPDEAALPAVVGTSRKGHVAAFLSSADTAGSFAGAPTINVRGELVGVALERVHEALASDWVLVPSTSRTIHTHAGHLVELLREAGGDALLDELDLRD